MTSHIALIAFLLCLWWYLSARRRAARKESLRSAISIKTRNLLAELQRHDTSESAPPAVKEALKLLPEAISDRLDVMSVRELEEIDAEFDEVINDVRDLPPSK